MKKFAKYWVLALAGLTGGTASAQEMVFSLGYTSYSLEGSEDSAIASIDYSHAPFFVRDRLSAGWGAAVEATAEGDLFAGAGVVTEFQLDNGWFLEGSVLPGLYDEGSAGNDLGSAFEIRSLFGIGRELPSGNRLSLAITHKSNASTADSNPGANAFLLRWHRPF
ncbi:Lipid A 3-O-deacylase (PagL) [Cribrihabitans marinus]|uniref:Lipid A 3-O-deacylase (PagL) n=1 Tax=Cribrihabitans marinus TaxID=1227549 RepID=A0A1H6SRR9_9RHOB|nr:acyloxyacyl hydrolase [Cribrihabitans marinus]GGH23345.1 hypothetical protein GCM10010973_09170 [Cribrihabitans marinus]SEI67477.1 Lipid A 3-O-deacylase (PagL) [Cribrihabitans marinus]